MTLYDYCQQSGHSILLTQWDGEKNAPLSPKDVSYGSHQKVWWLCPKGHSYCSEVKSRTQGTGCPYCAGRAVLPDENSLAAKYPTLAAEWETEKNAPLLPTQVAPGTLRKVWWLCPKGHSYYSSIASRAGGTGCPACAGQVVIPSENDLASQYPQLAAEWDGERNGALLPEAVTTNSNRKVWWLCGRGHSYAAPVAARTRKGSGCPYCANRKVLQGFNDLATLYPRAAVEWHPTLNDALMPEEVVAGSHRKAWWQCSLGHVWKAAIYSRTGGRLCGCPVCAGRTIDKYSTAGSRGKYM